MTKKAIRIQMARKATRTKIAPMTRTSASNPQSISQLEEAFKALRSAEQIPEKTKPQPPRKNIPAIPAKFRHMGEALEMCPYEIHAVFEHQFDTTNVLVKETLKRFLATMKLSGEVDLEPTRQMLRKVEDEHENRLQLWERDCEAVEKATIKRSEAIRKAESVFGQAWGKIIIDLIQKVDSNPDISSLGIMDKWMIRAIEETNRKAAKVDSNGLITMDFYELKKMKPEVIAGIPELAYRLNQEAKDLEFVEWLCKAPIEEIRQAAQITNDLNRSEFYATVLMYRKGLRPVRDYQGHFEWYNEAEIQAMAHDSVEWAENEFGHNEIEVYHLAQCTNEDLIHHAYRQYQKGEELPSW